MGDLVQIFSCWEWERLRCIRGCKDSCQ